MSIKPLADRVLVKPLLPKKKVWEVSSFPIQQKKNH